MNASEIIWASTLALTLYAGWYDWRTRRIPNWLTVPAFFIGIAVRYLIGGWRGAEMGLKGTGLALIVLLPLVLIRALGAGDWKLMGSVGAFLGPRMLLFVLLSSIFVSGLMAVVMMIQTKRVKETLRNMAALVHGFLSFGLRTHPEISLENPGLLKLPFGAAVALGTVICFFAAR
jgi:prepilin peptidase CpaA